MEHTKAKAIILADFRARGLSPRFVFGVPNEPLLECTHPLNVQFMGADANILKSDSPLQGEAAAAYAARELCYFPASAPRAQTEEVRHDLAHAPRRGAQAGPRLPRVAPGHAPGVPGLLSPAPPPAKPPGRSWPKMHQIYKDF